LGELPPRDKPPLSSDHLTSSEWSSTYTAPSCCLPPDPPFLANEISPDSSPPSRSRYHRTFLWRPQTRIPFPPPNAPPLCDPLFSASLFRLVMNTILTRSRDLYPSLLKKRFPSLPWFAFVSPASLLISYMDFSSWDTFPFPR